MTTRSAHRSFHTQVNKSCIQILLQIQRRFPEIHRLLSQVRVYFAEKPPPKGFEKFFKPKTGDKAPKSEEAGAKDASTKKPVAAPEPPPPSRASAGGSSSSSSRPPGDPWSSFLGGGGPRGGSGGTGGKPGGLGSEGGDKMIFLSVVATIGLLGTFAYYEMSYKEITWKDFVNR